MADVRWWKIGCLGLILAVGVGLLAVNEFIGVQSGDKIIDGIKCGGMVAVGGYHVHAHLALADVGKWMYAPAGVGLSQFGCYYWLHTHTSDGVIHIEARERISPTLGTFFDIWGQGLSRMRFWHYTIKPGKEMRVYVNQALYSGDPRAVVLRKHSDIAIEIGPPFVIPPRYHFGKL